MTSSTTADLLGDLAPSAQNSRGSADPGGYKIVSIRLRQAEFECFSEQAQELGLTHNLALRIAARRVAGFLEINEETRRLLRQISAEIGEISFGLGRLQRLAEEFGDVDIGKLAEYRAGFGHEFAVLDQSLQTILIVSQRRTDGLALLKVAAGRCGAPLRRNRPS
jgi:type IV secretion system T-DNA border endonuclease VirD1